MKTFSTHIHPLANIRRTRSLEINGRVIVRVGQKVRAGDVIANARLPGRHALIEVNRALGISEKKAEDLLISREVGETLQKDDTIAKTKGPFSRVVRAPFFGQVVAESRGRILMEKEGEPLELKAGITGTVIEIIPERGAIIETNGVLIQGVWGNQKAGEGTLLLLSIEPGEELMPSMLDASMRATVVAAGFCTQAETLQAAADLSIGGLILGGMTANLKPLSENMNYPIILLEGYGKLAINRQAFKLLSMNNKRDACLNAIRPNPFKGERPEVIIPLPSSGQMVKGDQELQTGRSVRIKGNPYHGQVGKVESLYTAATLPETQLRAPAAEIRLENGKQVLIPVANLDMLE